MRSVPYRELTGALLWVAIISRPDIAFAASHLAKFNSNPGQVHWKAAKRVLRYLSATRKLCLVLGCDNSGTDALTGYTDSDWARDRDDSRSYGAYVFMLGDSCVSWSSRKQPTVATSSTEAEYMALSNATKQAIWLRSLLSEIGLFIESTSTTMYADNRGAIELTKQPRLHSRTKHIPIHFHFIRQHVADKTISIVHCPTQHMIADGLTKPLPRVPFETFVANLGLQLV